MSTIQNLATRVDYSRTTVAEYLHQLTGNGQEKNRFFRVIPNLDESALGLHTLDVFMQTHSLDSIEKLEQVCDIHPYTKFRGRCYGANNGLFVQFRIPSRSDQHINALLERLRVSSYLEGFKILPNGQSEPLFTISRLASWSPDTFSWYFDWDDWFKIKPKLSTKKSRSSESRQHLLTKKDIHIISALNHGARRKQTELIEQLRGEGLDFSSQDFSRRLKRIEKRYISGYHVFIEPRAFDLLSNVIITAESTDDTCKMMKARLSTYPIPFRSTFKSVGSFLFWFVQLPPGHLSYLIENMHSLCSHLELTVVDHRKTLVYGPWAGAFNEEEGSWIADAEFMIDDVMQDAGLE